MEFKGTNRAEWKCNHDARKLFGLHVTEVYIESTEDELSEWITQVRGNSEQERKANAQLIETAPRMLEMLRVYLADLNNNVPPSHAQRNRIIDVEDLINQATKID
jgi:hypothetical protein